jgi:hypothetical protein
MCKIKDEILRKQDLMMGFNQSFFDYLYDYEIKNELSEKDINEMEKDSKEPLTVSSRILSNLALNNFDFNPKIGA